MKNLLFAFMLMFGAMFVSCGNSVKSTENTDSVPTDTIEVVDTVVVDTLSVDSL